MNIKKGGYVNVSKNIKRNPISATRMLPNKIATNRFNNIKMMTAVPKKPKLKYPNSDSV